MDSIDKINTLLQLQGTDLTEVMDHNSLSNFLIECRDNIERLRVIIWNLLDDGDEADRAAALAALKGDER